MHLQLGPEISKLYIFKLFCTLKTKPNLTPNPDRVVSDIYLGTTKYLNRASDWLTFPSSIFFRWPAAAAEYYCCLLSSQLWYNLCFFFLFFFFRCFQVAIEPSTLFHCGFVNVNVLLWCFTEEVKDQTRMEHVFVILNCIRIKVEVAI